MKTKQDKHLKREANRAKARAKPSPAAPKKKEVSKKVGSKPASTPVALAKTFVVRNREQPHLYWSKGFGWTNQNRATVFFESQLAGLSILPEHEAIEVAKPAFAGEGFARKLAESSTGEQKWEPIQANSEK